MADEKKKIREFEEATTIYEDDYLAIDGNIGKTRKIKPIKIGATYEIEDGDHEFTLVGSNGYEHTVAIPYDNVSMTQAEYNALTEEEKMDGTARFIPDAISTDESELWGRVGRATLETEAQVISNAVNELVDKTDDTNTIVGDGQQSVGSDLTDAVTQLDSSLSDIEDMLPTTTTNSGWRIISFPNIKMRILSSTQSITYPANTGSKNFDFTFPSNSFETVYSFQVNASVNGRTDTEVRYVRGSANGCQAYIACGATANTSGTVYVTAIGRYT